MSDDGAARLVVPEGFVIDETSRARLERQLALMPARVTGISAATSALAPGASYRVHAEWTALDRPERESVARSARSTAARGAVLVRAGVEFAVCDGTVAVASGEIADDPGAHTHDPHSPIGPLETASERGRPPFPRRPVVVFLSCETIAGDWLRRFVNRLVRRDIEARIAAPAAAAGLHLTRPCRAEEAAISALAPDVVVTLDPAAAARVDDWCAGDRSTVVVTFDTGMRDAMELVSWRIGQAAGRLRARIGPRVEAAAFASLVGRLCAGPHPMPPFETADERTRTPIREGWTNRRADQARAGCVILTGALDGATTARVGGLADGFAAAGLPVMVMPVTVAGDAAREASLVLLAGATRGGPASSVVAARTRAGLRTVLDVNTAAVEECGNGAHLTADARALAAACGAAVAPGGARISAARATAPRTMLLPTLLTRDRVTSLRKAREKATPGSPLVIGWRVDSTMRVAYAEAVAEAIAAYLVDHGARVDVVGNPSAVPEPLRAHPRVTVLNPGTLRPADLASWSLHVWTPALLGDTVLDDARLFEEASCAGVASVLPAAALTGVDGVVSPHVLVATEDRVDDWLDALHHVLDDDCVRAQRSQEAVRRADALNAPAAARALVTRLSGWAGYGDATLRVETIEAAAD